MIIGFLIVFIPMARSQCGTTEFSELTATINSPGYPSNYPDNSNCEYSVLGSMI